MATRASGSFEVKLTPQAAAEGVGDPSVGRMAIEKRFMATSKASSKGEMLATRTDWSRARPATSRSSGSTAGRCTAGAAASSLMHTGTMTRGRRD